MKRGHAKHGRPVAAADADTAVAEAVAVADTVVVDVTVASEEATDELRRSILGQLGRAGFEPAKALASRFTVCPVWPLRYLPFPGRKTRQGEAAHADAHCRS